MEDNQNLNQEVDIFNLPTEALTTPERTTTTEFYSPSADKGREGVYKSLVRFIPNVFDPLHSKIMKYYVWLEDPATQEGFSVDCPSTVGKKSILKDMYWKLKKSDSVKDQELAQKYFGRVESHYALVQVLKDDNQPDLVGKILVWKFGAQVNKKIEAALKPEYGSPMNPFDLFEGKVFAIQVVKKMNWNNYDQCAFVGDGTPLEIDGKPIQRTPEDQAKVVEYLKANSPDISKYGYKEWDEELTQKVMGIVGRIVPDGRAIEDIQGSAANAPTGGLMESAPKTSFSKESAPEQAPAQETATNAQETAAPAEGGGVSSINDLYDNL